MHDGVFYCMPHSSSVLLSSLATITGHWLISTPRYRYNYERLKSYCFETTFRKKTRFDFVSFHSNFEPFKINRASDSLDSRERNKKSKFFLIFLIRSRSLFESCLRKHEAKSSRTVAIERRS